MLPETKQEPEMEAVQASPAGSHGAGLEGLPLRTAAPAGPSACTPTSATTTQQQLDANRSGSVAHRDASCRALQVL